MALEEAMPSRRKAGEGDGDLLAALLEVSGEHIAFVIDCRRGGFDFASPRLSELHQTTPERLTAQGLRVVLDERLDRGSARHLRRHILTLCRRHPGASRRTTVDYPLRRKDGDDLWFECALQVEADAAGRPARIVGWAVDVTARLRGEVALREREGMYRATMDALQVGVFVLQDEVIRNANRTFHTLFGELDASAALVRGGLDLVVPEQRDFFAEKLRACARGEHVGAYELEGLRCDGSRFPLQMHAERSVFEGRPAVVCTAIDMTRERRTEHALKAAVRRYESLFEGAPDAILVVDGRSGRVVAANLAAQQLFACAGEALRGADLCQLCPQLHVQAMAVLGAEGEGAEVRAFEAEVVASTGETVPVEVRACPIETGFVDVHVQLILRDIRQRRADELALKRDACVFEASQEAIILTDAAQRIVTTNGAFLAMTGYAADEVVGRRPEVLRSGRHTREFYQDMWRELETSGRWQGEVWNRRRDGEIFPVWLRISVHRDESGRVCNYVGVSTDISERLASQESIRRLAFYDSLTGLPNRRLLHDRLGQLIVAAEREQTQVALLFIDLDHFKKVNDTLGHSIGDRLLVDVAQRLQGCVRRMDTVARLGGDEFVVLLADTTREGAGEVARKVLDVLAQSCWLGEHELGVTPSLGISLYPQDGNDGETLLKHADAAMYRAKDKGRNAFEFYTSDINRGALENFLLENDLRQAIKLRQFVLHYQPKLCLESGAIVGAEALIRWQHPRLGLLAPGRFIPLAENCGLIESVGDWVLHEACRQSRAWLDSGLPAVRVAVNISSVQFRSGRLDRHIRDILEATGVAPENLELELTEGVVMSEAAGAVEALERLSTMGIQIAIDDFGTGYSSLSYLKRFPIDRLKIDKSFVRDIAHDRDDRAIAKAVIRLGHSLKMRVVAEGVAAPEQLEALRRHGCDEIQGFHFSRPLPPADFASLLWQQREQSEHPSFVQ